MSLNGLDNVEVTQAYQGALAEAGGWFLLRYTSRDAVEVLTRGTGGAGEARAAVASYEDKSPLYGLLLYRRRKVLVKYVPEGTSRLLQARVTVHFINVTEKFAPCDIILSISSPEELSDAALASACTLHTAAPSSSSSSGSSRQQKLSYIQEAAEEGGPLNGEDTTVATRPATATTVPTILEPTTSNEEEPLRNGSVISQTSESVPLMLEEKVMESKPAPEISHVTVETVTEAPATSDSEATELQATLKSYDKLFEGGPEPRLSSQTARPNYDELYEHYYAQYSKPKVKLGPRPRPSLEGRRPSTSGGSAQDVARPKSSLPAGLRSATRKAAEQKVPKARTSSAIPTIAIPPPPPIPMTPEMPHSPVSPAYTSRSPASVRSMPVSTYSSHRSMGMTQEKTRLMKALELRKKQQKAQVERHAKKVDDAAVSAEAPLAETDVKKADTAPIEAPASEQKADTESTIGQSTALDKEDSIDGEGGSFGEELPSSTSVTGSGLVFTGSQTDTEDINSSASVSSPISAQTQGSSAAPSTRPSSISEDENPVLEESQKATEVEDVQSPDLVDEEQSVDSTPTVVPESRTPVPSVEVPAEPSPQLPSLDKPPSPDPFVEEDDSKRLTIPLDDDYARSRRRSKRESMIYMPSIDASQPDEAQMKRRNRESVLMPSSKRQSWYETKDKRRAMLDHLQVSAENSEAEYLSDDSFMEELQSATVHEAKPMMVSKSPITPFFSRKSSTTDIYTPPRSVSQGYQGAGRLSPEQSSRVSSGAWPPRSTADTAVVAKKINVSSGISQRIKALAEKSKRESVSSVSPATTLDTPRSSVAQRKSSFFVTTPVETSPSERPISRLGSPAFLNASASTTPEAKAQPVKATLYNVQRGAEKPESVQVTARIVRDERTKQPTLAMPTESTPLDLHASPLIIDHQKPTWTPRSPTRGRPEPASPQAPSSSHSREQSNSRTSSDSTWRAFSRRMSESKSIHSQEGDDRRDEKKDKKESRTSKMFKRMSSSMSAMPWKNSSSNLTLPEHDIRSTSLASLREPPPPVHVGDLNIQFPDTLLWKRRWVEIDALGNLVLSPSRSNEKGIVKRFHLSEFRTPYPPDQDRQELPNSVVLDFVDGRTLQCACETYIAQAQVLQILREAHDAWLAYNQAL
ncbi:Nn.00g102300.m01.CDS01 [Neocucurbitaria sp. VM-36]